MMSSYEVRRSRGAYNNQRTIAVSEGANPTTVDVEAYSESTHIIYSFDKNELDQLITALRFYGKGIGYED